MEIFMSDYFDKNERSNIEPDLDALVSECLAFNELEDRTREGLWFLLGSIYELAPAIEETSSWRERLVARVAERADVAVNHQWRPGKKKADDLLLVLLFGLERRQSRNQRLSALRAADRKGIQHSRASFVDWMHQVGGVGGASKLPKDSGPKQSDLRSCADRLKDIDLGFQPIPAPEPLIDPELPEGLGIVLVRKDANGALVPLGTLTSEKLVRSAARQLLRQLDKTDREQRSAIEDAGTRGHVMPEAERRFIGQEIIAGLHPEFLE